MAPFAPRDGGFIGFHTGPASQTPAPVSRRRAGRATARRGRHENRELPGGGKSRAAGSKTERPERQNAPPGREMQEVREAREKRGAREAGDKQTAQGKASAPCRIQIYVRPALLPPDRKRLSPQARRAGTRETGGRHRAAVGVTAVAAPRRLSKVSAPSPQRLSACGGSPVYSPAGRLRRYRRAAPRRLPKVSAPSPQRLTSASVSHSAGSLPSPVSGTGSAVTRSVNTGLLVVPNAFVASQ